MEYGRHEMKQDRHDSKAQALIKGKQTRAGQALRRRRIVDYIMKNGPVKGTEICRDLDMSRSSLSDDIRAINTAGEIILSPKRGIYVIKEQQRGAGGLYSRIDRQSVRRWMILVSLFEKDRSFGEIMDYLGMKGISCAKSVLYEDLKSLTQARLIERGAEGRERIYHADSLYETDLREIRQYEAGKAGNNARVDIMTYEKIDRKIRHTVPGYERDADRDEIRRAGKHNALTEEQVQMLREFEKHPFAEKELLITFRTNAGREVQREICVGIIVYVVGTARIYLLGENRWPGQGATVRQHKNYVIIPMDRILTVSEGMRANTCYNSPEYHRICREMFQISTEEQMNVRVRFENYPFIRDKIERLCAVRETAHMEIAGNEIVFTDTVRGKGDLARYLRRFGRSAIVEEPAELRAEMISASRKILQLYEAE